MLTIDQIRPFWNPSKRKTASNLASQYNLNPDTIRKAEWFNIIHNHIAQDVRTAKPLTSPAVPVSSSNDIEDLLEERCQKYRKKYLQEQEARIKTVAVGAKPIAILHLGDPHLDDDGCDLPLLREHIKLATRCPRVYGGNIGDTTNNWIGRLERLYAKQSTTFDEAIALAEWLCRSIEWAYFVIGNHDSWNQGSTILKLLLRQSKVWAAVGHECRLSLRFDNGVVVNICARHDHKGRSMYHSTHGALKAHIFGDRWADLHISGHTHQWGMMQIETEDGKPRWAIRVRGYKRMDEFAREKGFYEHQHGSACLTVINPYVPECDRILPFWDVSTGLKYLESVS